MRIKLLVLAIIVAQFITTDTLVCAPVGFIDGSGLTNLQKIARALNETQENQRKEVERRQGNVILARVLLNNCSKISDAGERATCEKKYQAVVKSSRRACGPDCQ
jgi:hypothetical protein